MSIRAELKWTKLRMIVALYRWIERRKKIPRWVKRIYPYVHFCWGMLIFDDIMNCRCGLVPRWEKLKIDPRYVGQ